MKTTKMQGRRPMPKIHQPSRTPVERAAPTLGDLVSAAFDTLHDTGAVVRVLSSNRMAGHIGRKLVFL
jgi:hypothetical protein